MSLIAFKWIDLKYRAYRERERERSLDCILFQVAVRLTSNLYGSGQFGNEPGALKLAILRRVQASEYTIKKLAGWLTASDRLFFVG